jgi:PAS domain S-box-containing protein
LSPDDPKALLARPGEQSFKRTPISVLLLEDNPADASLELQTLKAAGLPVTSDVVRTARAFMEAVRSKSYQVILCDYSLPGWNGLDALRWVRSSGFKMPFIYVSGTLGEEVAVECLKEGATDYVIKANLERLPHSIRRALREEKLRSEKDQAESEARRSEERYRLLFESNPQPMWVFHLATLRFLAVNEAAIDHYQYSRSEFLSMTLRDVWPPEDIPALEDSIWKNPEYPDTPRIWRHRTKYGRVMFAEVTARNIEFDGQAASLVLAIDVTNRINAEDALKRSEAGYRSIVQGAPYGIYRVNHAGRVLMANPALVAMLGCNSQREVLQLNTTSEICWNPEEIRMVVSTAERVRPNYETKWRRRDGQTITVRLAGRELPGEAGAPPEYEVFVENITERERGEHLLRESEENYRTLFESMDEGFCTIEVLFNEKNEPQDYRFLDVNPAFEKHTGIQNARGKRMREIAPEHEEHWFATYGKIALTGEPARFENVAAQLHRCYEVHAFRVGEPRERKVAIFFSDITERKQAEDALKRSEAEYRSIVQGAPYGIYRVNDKGQVMMTNPALVTMLGCKSEAEVLELNTMDKPYWDPTELGAVVSNGKQLLRHHEGKWKRKDGKPIMVRLVGTKLPGGVVASPEYEVFVENITEQRSLEAQFRQAQKMEAVGQLAGGVAHDFNNLLMIIASYARLIPLHIDDRDKIAKDAIQIDEAVARAASVTQQLLAFSRKQVLQPTVLNLNTLVLGLGKMLPRLLGEDVEMSLATHSTGKVKADATQLEQVILNLAVNARDAMPSGGKLIIETSDVYLDGLYPGHEGTAIPAGDYVMLAVSDTGMGMDRETQTHIFEPFFTTKANTGTGLGLSTVYGIVKQSGGFVWVYSELGSGTTFKVYLPKVEGPEDRTRHDLGPGPDPRGDETILLAEDEAALRTVVAIYLESLGYTVLSSGNGEEALLMLQSHSQSIDLLITDIIMPGIAGPQLARIAQEVRPGVPVIYISGYTDRALDRSTIGEGAAFLQKPFRLGALAVKIREVLEIGLDA